MEIELAKYIASKKHAPHEWAINDCNTFMVEWHDAYYGTDWFDELQFDYDDYKSAARFHRGLPFTGEEFLQMIGYEYSMLKPKTGDVIMENMGPYFCAWLVLQEYAYTIHYKQGLVRTHLEEFADFTLWSKS